MKITASLDNQRQKRQRQGMGALIMTKLKSVASRDEPQSPIHCMKWGCSICFSCDNMQSIFQSHISSALNGPQEQVLLDLACALDLLQFSTRQAWNWSHITLVGLSDKGESTRQPLKPALTPSSPRDCEARSPSSLCLTILWGLWRNMCACALLQNSRTSYELQAK